MSRVDNLVSAFNFFKGKHESGCAFSVQDVVGATGYGVGTVKTYISKYWERFLERTPDGFFVVGAEFKDYTVDIFGRISSQKTSVNQDPFKPTLSQRSEELIAKSREAALLAVQIYNNPLVVFRTPGFIVHMIIAYTSLFHAIFEEAKEDYWYKDETGGPESRGGKVRFWELSTSMNHYWQEEHSPIRENLRYFISLRNEIEHRFAPAFDSLIAGECQALMFNYEKLLVEHFSPYFSLGTHFSVPIQLSKISQKARLEALKEMQKTDYLFLREYTERHRILLDNHVFESQDYAFNVFLVPKVANRASAGDISVEFLRADEVTEEQMEQILKYVALVKTKTVPVANQGKYLPKDVVDIIQQTVEPRFRTHEHTQAWKYFKVRPKDRNPEECDIRFCQYDAVHNSFIYTEAWVEKLKKAISDPSVYQKIRNHKER